MRLLKTRLFVGVLAALVLAANLPALAQNLFEGDWSVFYSGNNIYQFTPDGAKTNFATGVFQAVGLAFDSSSNLFVANGVVGTITKITPNGTQSTFASGLSYPFGLAFNAVGNLFEADLGSGNIYQFTPNGAHTTFASGLNRPCALAVDSAGNLFVADQGSGNIYKFTPNGSQSTFASGSPYDINGLAFNRAGYLFVNSLPMEPKTSSPRV
jgi:sugar lactone lactonase YvrE